MQYREYKMHRITMLVLFSVILVFAPGCRGRSGASGADTKIELYDGHVKMTGLETIHAEVKYRFASGRPNPDSWYWFELELNALYTMARIKAPS